MKKQKNSRYMLYFRYITIALVILALTYFIYGQFYLPRDTVVYTNQIMSYNDGWMEVKEDGTREPIKLPGHYNQKITLVNTIPQDLEFVGSNLLLRGERLEIYIDGELRMIHDNSATRAFGDEVTDAYTMVPLKAVDQGKEIVVKIEGMSGVVFDVRIGTQLGIWLNIAKHNGGEIVVAMLTIFLGILAILCVLFLQRTYKQSIPLIYLSIGIILGAFWILFNSHLRDLYFNNVGMATDMTFVMIMLTPFPLMIYLNELQKCRYEKFYFAASLMNFFIFITTTLLHITGEVDYHITFPMIAFGCMFAILVISLTFVVDICKKQVRDYYFVAIGFFCVVTAAVMQIVAYMAYKEAFSGIFLATGLMLMLIFAVIHTLLEVKNVMDEKKRVEMASEAKGRFLANMSHEIRTPVNAILGMDEMILRESNNPDILNYASDIKSASQNLLSIINDILDISKIEAGRMELVKMEYDFGKLLHDLIVMIRPKARGKELELKLEIQSSLPSRLYGDSIRLQQILLNILSNAVKYTEKGRVTFRVKGKSIYDDLLLYFEVEDTGIGIKKEDLEKVFVEFERFDLSRNYGVEGTGLGMSITNKLLHLMDSTLQVESEYGIGSKFSFELHQKILNNEPIGQVGKNAMRFSQHGEGTTRLVAPGAKLLVVDDKRLNRKVFHNLLKNMEVEIEEAGDGLECIELAKKTRYDLIFMDHMMPRMDGVEAFKNLRELPDAASYKTPVVALTANAIYGARERYLDMGFVEYLSKPIIPEKLDAILKEYLPQCREIDLTIKGEKRSTSSVMQQLETLEGIELQEAMKFMTDEAMYLEVIRDFHRSMASDCQELESFYFVLRSQDAPSAEVYGQYRTKVHSMKSSAKMIGAFALSEHAKMLEDAAREENLGYILEATEPFAKEWMRYEEMLSFVSEETPEDRQNAGLLVKDYPDAICSVLDLLAADMENLEVDRADGFVKLLLSCSFPEECQEDVKKLEDAVLKLQIEETKALCEALKERL